MSADRIAGGTGAYPPGLADMMRCLCCDERTPGGGICDACRRATCTFGEPKHAPAFIVCNDPTCQPYGEHYQRLHGRADYPATSEVAPDVASERP